MEPAFLHMHLLGTSMRVDVGASDDEMKAVFTRDPYDFDDQHIEPIQLTLEPGGSARVNLWLQAFGDHRLRGEHEHRDVLFMGFALDREGLGTCTERRAQAKR